MPEGTLEVPKTGQLITSSGGDSVYILEAHRGEKSGNVNVLLFIPNGAQKFATGVYVGVGWMWGHYFDNVNEALSDFMERT